MCIFSGATYASRNNNPGSRATSPGTNTGGSGIPTPGGRTLTPRGDKQNRVVSTGSTTSTSSSTSNKSNSQKPVPTNKNSMLDKFKFFNSKDKTKNKTLPKSVSKTSTTSSSSDAKSTASSARSSSSTDPGATSSSTQSNDSESPKLPPKTKSIVKYGGRVPLQQGVDEFGIRQGVNPTSASSPPVNNLTVPGQSSSSKKSLGSKSSDKHDNRSGQVSPSQAKKGSKIGTLIPKSSSSGKTSSKPLVTSPSNGVSSGIPTPSSSSSIPKPGSSGKSSSKSVKGGRSPQSASSTLPSSSSSNSSQRSNHASTPSKSMQCQQQSQTLPPVHSVIQSRPSSRQSESRIEESPIPQDLDSDKMQHKTRYTEVEYTDGRIERVGEGHFNKPNNLPVSSPMKMSSNSSQSGRSQGYAYAHASHNQQIVPPNSQTVNVVKPTVSASTAASTVLTKADGSSQASLSVLSRATPPPLPKTEPPQESHVKDKEYKKSNSTSSLSGQSTPVSIQSGNNSGSDSTPSSNSHSGSKSHSSSESVIYKPSSGEEFSGSELGGSSAANSPRLGLKVLHSNLRPNTNVAIVQPRHGEKIETTFDAEGKTETVKSDEPMKNSKETTFSEKSEKDSTFVDDSGETMDIKPMQPIMRAMPYGSSGYLRGYGSPQNNSGKIFHNPGYATPQMAYYARSSSMGINRPVTDSPQRYYPGSMRRTLSSGQQSETDYNSDYDYNDYVSGYMSDGDILKGNKTDDMMSGYLSEGGASLYARRLQQRFREGMQAVKECMQKSSGILDDDRLVLQLIYLP